MKNLILLSTFIISTNLLADSFQIKQRALIRNKSGNAVLSEVVLQDLLSQEKFEGEHFKIVKGKSDEAIAFSADEDLRLRAATAYYHLTIARNYWIQKIKSSYVESLPQLTIRIDHFNQFNELGHFANDNYEVQYNNALTIPAGVGLERKGVKPWNIEIWFRPAKKIHISEIKVNGVVSRQYKMLLKEFRDQIHMQSFQMFLSQLILSTTKDGANLDPFSADSLMRTVGSSVLIEFGYQAFEPINKLFSRKWYWLDTAMIPEIIYHEYSHVALSDSLKLTHSTPIIEGMADFFAGEIAHSPLLALHIKKYNTYNGKNATRKQEYTLQFESGEYANTDFVFGLLWDMKRILGDDKADNFIFTLRKKLTTNSSIRDELIEGLLQTCEEQCENPFVDKIRILKGLNSKGL
ncbi:MAG: hypothetical protein AB7I27_10475 [Bacteriovoracaceae bacterium]